MKRLDILPEFLPFAVRRQRSPSSAALGRLVLDGHTTLVVAHLRALEQRGGDEVPQPFAITASGLATTALTELLTVALRLKRTVLCPTEPTLSTTLQYGLPQDGTSVRLRYDAANFRRSVPPLLSVVISASSDEARVYTNGENLEGQGDLSRVGGVLPALREDLAVLQNVHGIRVPPNPIIDCPLPNN